MADEAFLDLVAKGSEQLVAPPEDSLVEIVHTAGGGYERASVGATVSVVTAEVVPGTFAAAVRWGVEVADLLSEITGLPSLFGRNVDGPFGGLEWVQTGPDLTAFERAWDQVGKDGRHREKREETVGLFVEGSGQRVVGRRVAELGPHPDPALRVTSRRRARTGGRGELATPFAADERAMAGDEPARSIGARPLLHRTPRPR